MTKEKAKYIYAIAMDMLNFGIERIRTPRGCEDHYINAKKLLHYQDYLKELLEGEIDDTRTS